MLFVILALSLEGEKYSESQGQIKDGTLFSFVVLFFFNLFIFKLKDNCFTEFCCLLSNINVISHRYTYVSSLLNLPPIPPKTQLLID